MPEDTVYIHFNGELPLDTNEVIDFVVGNDTFFPAYVKNIKLSIVHDSEGYDNLLVVFTINHSLTPPDISMPVPAFPPIVAVDALMASENRSEVVGYLLCGGDNIVYKYDSGDEMYVIDDSSYLSMTLLAVDQATGNRSVRGILEYTLVT